MAGEKKSKTWPFSGVRVLGCTQYVASSRAAAMLGELGAEVIKIEGHARPDPGRVNVFNPGSFAVFPDGVPGPDWWNRNSFFNTMNRGQLSLTLDLTKERGRELFRNLVKVSDVVLESFTPRVMAKWSLDYDSLKKIKPDLVMVSLTGFGHGDGPYTDFRGTATVMEATHGHCYITGHPDGPPSKASVAFVDFVAAWSIVLGVAGALRQRLRTGEGQWIDASLYQPGVMLLSEYVLDYQVNGRIGARMGNRHASRLQGCYPAKGVDSWIAFSLGADAQWSALCDLMSQHELKDDARFATLLDRLANQDELDLIIAGWTKERDKYELFHALQARGIPAAPVLNAQDMHTDPHFLSRDYLGTLEYPPEREMESRPIVRHPWKFSGETPEISSAGPMLGEHNQQILEGMLGLGAAEIAELEREGVIGSELVGYAPRKEVAPSDMVTLGIIETYVPNYREDFPK